MTRTLPEDFSPARFVAADPTEREHLCGRLAETLSQEFRVGREWTETAYGVIQELRKLGHDLWSFDDESPRFQIWCPDWSRTTGALDLTLHFDAPDFVSVSIKIDGHLSEADAGRGDE
jgi:hypothetical protein